jgi:hypothetical protein
MYWCVHQMVWNDERLSMTQKQYNPKLFNRFLMFVFCRRRGLSTWKLRMNPQQ